ncbi:serine hydrolase domain-containing protein [Hyphococcus luteus]|uniref:Beta-lactamase-related domain-containing protein n=1 Tax=Hyphococcus luteus TaxID=2058213 RepID=A0A2S7K7N9_9PROT|nr:serine hydrolase domain-containing protein [Marinicaulis flavus]PQA88502.1 hypothetical protein CW354_09450 [Marinicaulis flavus]
MRLSLVVAFVIAVFAGAASAQVPSPDAAPSTPVATVELDPFEPTREEAVLESYVDGVVAAHRREHDAPAVAVSVVRDGRILFAKAYGDADVETGAPASGTRSLFRIGSVSKTFTWTAVMMLYERGLIDLDEDVNRYLKGMQIPEAFDAPVTMNDLMAHRAGFEDTLEVFTVPDTTDKSLTDVLAEQMPKRVYPPGTRTSYSNWGAALAAKIVEDVSGVPYEKFLQDEILTPLSMTHTTLKGPALMNDETRAALAKAYELKAGDYAPADYMEIGPYAPAGAMASTANDMAQWMLLHMGRGEYNGAKLMRPQTHDFMWTRAFDDRPAGADLAHGFMTRHYRDVVSFGHGGATSSYYTDMTMVPQFGIGVFVSQSGTMDRTLVSDLPWLVIDHVLDAPPDFAHDDPGFADKAEGFAGAYLDNRRSFSRFEKLFATDSTAEVAPAKGGLTVSIEGKTFHYAPVKGAADTFENRHGARLVFGRDEKGRVTHFTGSWGVHSYERVGFATNPLLLNLAFGLALLFSVTTVAGAWRRQGRGALKTRAGALVGLGAIVAAGLVFALAGAFVWMAVQMANADAAMLLSYPPASIVILRLVALGVFAVAIAGLVSLWPAWSGSGWRVWRKLHHTAFALALAYFALMLVVWNVIFAPTA